MEVEQNGNSTTNSTPTVFALETFALQIQQLDPKDYKGQMFDINLGSLEEAKADNQTIDQRALITSQLESKQESDNTDTRGIMNSMTTASLQLPKDLLDSCMRIDTNANSTQTITQRLSYSVFKSNILFQNLNQSQLSIGSIIVAARLKCANDLILNTSIKSIFQVNRTVRIAVEADSCGILCYSCFFHRWKKVPKTVHVQYGTKVTCMHVDYCNMHHAYNILPQETPAQWIDLGRGRQKDVEWSRKRETNWYASALNWHTLVSYL